jgi:exodeoxyribonuclease-3
VNSFTLATWNVNSIKVRLEQVVQWLQTHSIDLLALQETKTVEADFPREAFTELGYQVICSGQKTYNGMALISRGPCEDIVTDFPGYQDPQRRLLAATYQGVRVLNLYIPNGESVSSDKFQYKLAWLAQLQLYLGEQLQQTSKLVAVGDFNIAPTPADVHDPSLWEGKVLFSEPERQAFQRLLDCGLEDCFRRFSQPEKSYSWWDYRMLAFRRNQGLRIDHVLASTDLALHCQSCTIDKAPRALERPSDHAPVIASFAW